MSWRELYHSWPGNLELRAAQSQRVGYDGNGADRHRRARNDWRKDHTEKRVERAGRERNSQRVITECKHEILADVFHCRATERAGTRDAAQIAAQQSDSCGFDRDIRAVGHGDADICLRKRRSVVDTVASHCDDVALLLQTFYDF